MAGSPFAQSIEGKELKGIQNVLKVERETTLVNVEKALSFNAGYKALGDKLRAGGFCNVRYHHSTKVDSENSLRNNALFITRHMALEPFNAKLENQAWRRFCTPPHEVLQLPFLQFPNVIMHFEQLHI